MKLSLKICPIDLFSIVDHQHFLLKFVYFNKFLLDCGQKCESLLAFRRLQRLEFFNINNINEKMLDIVV
ncbi:hypothetical protein [Helicobacter pylori]|uniref:hypothetical protein n=1 Tax=Helicobacter pylori TaxID=210 RepID=UPI001883CCAA|nr:hypothetical protein [Helicobacter pylori]